MTNANLSALSALSALSMSELKARALELNVTPTGDKRSKQSWILAIESFVPTVEIADDDTFDLDGWDAPVTIPDAEMEAIAHAADVSAPTTATAPTRKSGAVLIFGSLLCVLILAFRATFAVGSIALKLGSYLVRLFGSYDPSLDLSWQFAQFRRERLDPATAT